jgi:hypothetical protein
MSKLRIVVGIVLGGVLLVTLVAFTGAPSMQHGDAGEQAVATNGWKITIDLLHAAGPAWWPLAFVIAILVLRKDLAALLRRLRKLKLFGQEGELDPAAAQLKATTAQAEAAVPDTALPHDSKSVEKGAAPTTQAPPGAEEDVAEVLRQAAQSPEVALIRLAVLIERELRLLLGDLGLIPRDGRISISHAAATLLQHERIPGSVARALGEFGVLRNRIVHGIAPAVDRRDMVSVIDSGISLLRTIKAVPRESRIVHAADVALFADAKLIEPLQGVWGVILETRMHGGGLAGRQIFPTSRHQYYKTGMRVTWEWNFSKSWGEAWYLDPVGKEPTMAWGNSAEFYGRPMDEA